MAWRAHPAPNRPIDMTQQSKARLGISLWGTVPIDELARQAQLAEAIGCDSVWVIDSQLLCREVYLSLAAILARTTTLRAATGVTQPTTRHPSVAASALATLVEAYGERVTMGIGTGFSSLRTIALPAAKIAEVEQYVTAVRQLLRDGLTWRAEPLTVCRSSLPLRARA